MEKRSHNAYFMRPELREKKLLYHYCALDSGVKPVKKSFASPAETPVKSGLKQQMAMISQTKKTPPSLGNPDLKLAVGDRIQDAKFGQGTVLRAEAMGNDYLLEIAFDDVGTKKLMARFRQITKL